MKATGPMAGLAALALLLAGCGGAARTPTVARLGPGSTSTGASPGGSSAGASSGSPESQAVAYSACVRAHGVPNFPDPKISSSGGDVRVSIGINPSIANNPHFKSAQQACAKLMPGGAGPGSKHLVSPQEQSQFLKAAACIRAHGIPNFPDPTFSGGTVRLPTAAGIDPRSPRVRAAAEACQALIPGGLRGNH